VTDVDDIDRVFEFKGVKHYLEHYALWWDSETGKRIYTAANIARLGHEKDGRESWTYGQAVGILTAMLEMAPFVFGALSIKLLQTHRNTNPFGKPPEVNAEEAARFAQAFAALTDDELEQYRILLSHERGDYLRGKPAFQEPLDSVKQVAKKQHKLRSQVEGIAKEGKLVDFVMRHLPAEPEDREDVFKQALVASAKKEPDDLGPKWPHGSDELPGKEKP